MGTLAIAIGVGIILGSVGFYLFTQLASNTEVHGHQQNTNSHLEDNEPLYWVAPMDPNFKRDKPGKSPMGMDLVPVYENESVNDSPGTVKIDPITINNLGVKTTTVKMMTPEFSIQTMGTVSFAEDAIVHIHPRVEGWVESLKVRAKGDYIEQGEALYSLYSPDLVNAQEELLIAIEQGDLQSDRNSTRALINAAKSRLQALNAPANLIKRIEETRKIERTITFNAPQSGYVNELNIQSGFYVTPSTTMLSIANMDKVWVLADIFASDLSKVAIGQSAVVKSDYFPLKEVTTDVAYIYPTLDSKTRTAKARLVIDNKDLTLKPDMYTSVLINAYPASSNSSTQILAVPEQAIIRTGETNRVVLALGEGKFKSINITLGHVFDEVIEVTSGVQEGDVIVSSAQFLIDSESSITSDFMRMQPLQAGNKDGDNDHMADDSSISAWTTATVNDVMVDERMVNITHGPLDAFNMMGMTMNFMVANHIDMTEFKQGIEIHTEVVKTQTGMYMLKTVHFMDVHFMDKHSGMDMTNESDSHMQHETKSEPQDHNNQGGQG